jgi:hypothetical protein
MSLTGGCLIMLDVRKDSDRREEKYLAIKPKCCFTQNTTMCSIMWSLLLHILLCFEWNNILVLYYNTTGWLLSKKILGNKPDQGPPGRHKSNIEFSGVESRSPQWEAGRENRVYSPQYNVLSFQVLFELHLLWTLKRIPSFGKILWVCLFSPMSAITSDPRYPIRLELSDKITFIE